MAGALPETWSGYSQHAVDTLPLPTKHLPASEVLKFRDHAFSDYFADQPYLGLRRAPVRRRHGRAYPRDVLAPARTQVRRCLNIRGTLDTRLRRRRRHADRRRDHHCPSSRRIRRARRCRRQSRWTGPRASGSSSSATAREHVIVAAGKSAGITGNQHFPPT